MSILIGENLWKSVVSSVVPVSEFSRLKIDFSGGFIKFFVLFLKKFRLHSISLL